MSVPCQLTDQQRVLRSMFVELEPQINAGGLLHKFTADELFGLHVRNLCQITVAVYRIVACVALRPANPANPANPEGLYELGSFWATPELEEQKWPRKLFFQTLRKCADVKTAFIVADNDERVHLAMHLKMKEVIGWQDDSKWKNAYRNGRFLRDPSLRLFEIPKLA